MKFRDIFGFGKKEPTEKQLLLTEIDSLIVYVDWREEEVEIVKDFANATGEGLTAELTPELNLIISYQGRKIDAGLQGDMGDRYRTLRTLRNILSHKYEIRILKDSLLSDTHGFLVKEKEWWQRLEIKYNTLTAETFVPFTNDIEFS